LSPSIETTICSFCGGRTGTLSTPQTPGTPSSAVPKTPRLPPPPHISRPPSAAPPPAKKRRTGSSEDPIPQASPEAGSSSGVGVVDQAGVEALLQLGHLQNEDESNAVVVTELQTPVKKRKLNEGSPMTGMMGPGSLQQSFYTHLSQSAHDPNIDPFLRQNGLESESPTTATSLDHESNLAATSHYHQLPNFTTQLPDAYVIKSIPILEKINAFSKICKPLPSMSGPGFPRLPIVAIEGEDVETVTELFHALAKDIRKSEPIHVIDEPELFTPTVAEETADIEGLLIPTGLDSSSTASLVPVSSTKDKDRHDDDDDAARYLSHVASWRRRCAEIKKAVTSPPGGDGAAPVTMNFGEDSAVDAPSVVLVNRYMVSRSDVAAARLAADGLTPLQHWQWCATVWRGCVGPDMTIYVNPVPEGGVRSEEAVEVRDSGRIVFVRKEEGVRKEWDEKIVRRLGFEVGEVVRSLRGFGA
jgi:HMG box factor